MLLFLGCIDGLVVGLAIVVDERFSFLSIEFVVDSDVLKIS